MMTPFLEFEKNVVAISRSGFRDSNVIFVTEYDSQDAWTLFRLTEPNDDLPNRVLWFASLETK